MRELIFTISGNISNKMPSLNNCIVKQHIMIVPDSHVPVSKELCIKTVSRGEFYFKCIDTKDFNHAKNINYKQTENLNVSVHDHVKRMKSSMGKTFLNNIHAGNMTGSQLINKREDQEFCGRRSRKTIQRQHVDEEKVVEHHRRR